MNTDNQKISAPFKRFNNSKGMLFSLLILGVVAGYAMYVLNQESNESNLSNGDCFQKGNGHFGLAAADNITFEIVNFDDFIEINIETISETCLAGFEIQRASEEGIFKTVMEERVFGDSLGASYLLIDDIKPVKNIDYRLKVVNLDGTYEFSGIN